MVEYDSKGNVASRTSTSRSSARAGARGGEEDEEDSDDDDEFDFTGAEDSGWKQMAAAVAADLDEEVAEAATGAGAKGGAGAASVVPAVRAKAPAVSALPSPTKKAKGGAKAGAKGGAGSVGSALGMRDEALLLGDGDDDFEYWGVEELEPRGSLLEELGVVKGKNGKRVARGVDEELGVSVAWGGNASSTAVDLDEQERLLSLMFKPHKVQVWESVGKQVGGEVWRSMKGWSASC